MEKKGEGVEDGGEKIVFRLFSWDVLCLRFCFRFEEINNIVWVLREIVVY